MINIEIKLKSGATVHLSIEEAKDLHEQLGTLFMMTRITDALDKYTQSRPAHWHGNFSPLQTVEAILPATGPTCCKEGWSQVEPQK